MNLYLLAIALIANILWSFFTIKILASPVTKHQDLAAVVEHLEKSITLSQPRFMRLMQEFLGITSEALSLVLPT